MFNDRVVIRPQVLGRVYVALFGVAWTAFLGGISVAGLLDGQIVPALIPLAMAAIGAFITAANLRPRVIVEADELRVRNFVRERRHERGTIVRFADHGSGGMPTALGGCIAVLLDDGQLVDLRATATGPFSGSRRTEQLRQLEGWLAAGR